MRIKIKNADFSSVSIGKITKDFSFSYPNYATYATILENPVNDDYMETHDSVVAGTGHNGITTFWMASAGDQTYNQQYNENRITSQLIEVTEGMIISMKLVYGISNTPSIICYDTNKNLIIPPVAFWAEGYELNTYTIPSGVKYIRFQHAGLHTNIYVMGTMPN